MGGALDCKCNCNNKPGEDEIQFGSNTREEALGLGLGCNSITPINQNPILIKRSMSKHNDEESGSTNKKNDLLTSNSRFESNKLKCSCNSIQMDIISDKIIISNLNNIKEDMEADIIDDDSIEEAKQSNRQLRNNKIKGKSNSSQSQHDNNQDANQNQDQFQQKYIEQEQQFTNRSLQSQILINDEGKEDIDLSQSHQSSNILIQQEQIQEKNNNNNMMWKSFDEMKNSTKYFAKCEEDINVPQKLVDEEILSKDKVVNQAIAPIIDSPINDNIDSEQEGYLNDNYKVDDKDKEGEEENQCDISQVEKDANIILLKDDNLRNDINTQLNDIETKIMIEFDKNKSLENFVNYKNAIKQKSTSIKQEDDIKDKHDINKDRESFHSNERSVNQDKEIISKFSGLKRQKKDNNNSISLKKYNSQLMDKANNSIENITNDNKDIIKKTNTFNLSSSKDPQKKTIKTITAYHTPENQSYHNGDNNDNIIEHSNQNQDVTHNKSSKDNLNINNDKNSVKSNEHLEHKDRNSDSKSSIVLDKKDIAIQSPINKQYDTVSLFSSKYSPICHNSQLKQEDNSAHFQKPINEEPTSPINIQATDQKPKENNCPITNSTPISFSNNTNTKPQMIENHKKEDNTSIKKNKEDDRAISTHNTGQIDNDNNVNKNMNINNLKKKSIEPYFLLEQSSFSLNTTSKKDSNNNNLMRNPIVTDNMNLNNNESQRTLYIDKAFQGIDFLGQSTCIVDHTKRYDSQCTSTVKEEQFSLLHIPTQNPISQSVLYGNKSKEQYSIHNISANNIKSKSIGKGKGNSNQTQQLINNYKSKSKGLNISKGNKSNVNKGSPNISLLKPKGDEFFNQIVFHSTLRKISVENLPALNSNTKYVNRFCLLTDKEFKTYISKEQFITLQKPFNVISLDEIEKVELIKLPTSRSYNAFSLTVNIECKETNQPIEEIIIFQAEKRTLAEKWVSVLQYFLKDNN